MDNTNNSNRLRYAIVKAIRTSSDPERFVVGYRTEQSLYEFLVATCIVASGYPSREEAARHCGACEIPGLLAAA